ncbi:MAG: hypothetical protein KKF56_05105 [Nanoarchaeota archaeon]|nr:hypothetical protein [Nanoarchaeota archaeon]
MVMNQKYSVVTMSGRKVYTLRGLLKKYQKTGTTNKKPSQLRKELRGQPILKGLLGPMWDRTTIRYETAEVYERLSS